MARTIAILATALGVLLLEAAEPRIALPPGFPARFPLPPGHRVTEAASSISGFTLTLRVASASEALDFYRTALPRAGYHVREGSLRPRGGLVPGEESPFAGGLNFTIGSGDAESDAGGIDAIRRADDDRVDIVVPRVGVMAERKDASPWPAPPATSRETSSRPTLTLPAPFPLPPGHRQASFARSGDGVLTATMETSGGPTTWEFYLSALRAAGYELREVWRPDSRSPVFLGRLAFRGHGQLGRLTVTSDVVAARLVIRFVAEGPAE